MDVRLSEWRGGNCEPILLLLQLDFAVQKKTIYQNTFFNSLFRICKEDWSKKNMKKRPKNLFHNIAGITVHCRVQRLDVPVGNRLLYL